MTPFTYATAPDLKLSPIERWAATPREPDILCYATRTAGALALRGWLATYFRLRIDGREHLPRASRRSFVMVANHASHLDALCLLSALPLSRLHHAFPAAAADYFFATPSAGALSGVFMNALPFERKRNVRRTLDTCRTLLAQPGNALILFPEGTRTTTGHMGEFRGGVGELVAGTNVPVVPCYLDAAFDAWPKGRWIPRPAKLTLSVGRPMRFAHLKRNRASCDQVAAELESAVRALGEPFNQTRNAKHERRTRNTLHARPAIAAAGY